MYLQRQLGEGQTRRIRRVVHRRPLAFLGQPPQPDYSTAAPPSLPSLPPAVAAAMQQVFPKITGHTGFTNAAYNWTLSAVEAGYLPVYYPQRGKACGASKTPGLLKAAITSEAGSITTTIATAIPALATNPIGWAIAGVGLLIAGIGAIFSHHAHAVAKEQGTLCAAVPAANDALEQLDQLLAEKSISATNYIAALQAIDQQFEAMARPIVTGSLGSNEAGGYIRALQGIIARRTADAQAVAAGSQGSVAALSMRTGISPAMLFGVLFVSLYLYLD